ncbi:unnamed protein product [Callosobruchus maculatus]|uniref:Uncharacterized protein n=1 Tax=Callosobruchus maculatus TaxID=64391 RepID=A0A653BVP6_CALMS|nr:unnamed protein product [Callosobruchus maculatus]
MIVQAVAGPAVDLVNSQVVLSANILNAIFNFNTALFVTIFDIIDKFTLILGA